jgi:hypothetical protein
VAAHSAGDQLLGWPVSRFYRSLLLKPLRPVREVELGDFSFDGLFLVRGEEQAARQLLTLAVRQATRPAT